jgi:hypothetical protein
MVIIELGTPTRTRTPGYTTYVTTLPHRGRVLEDHPPL